MIEHGSNKRVREEVEKMRFLSAIGTCAAVVLSFSLVLLAPGTSSADKQVNARVILLISDEILGNSVEIERPDGAPPIANLPPGVTSPGLPGPADPNPTLADGPDDGDDSDRVASHDGNDKNRSGFGDGSNPGLNSDNNNSGNDGYDNPSNAPDTVGQSSKLR